MPHKVQHIVLSFTIHVSHGLLGDSRATLSCAPAMSVRVFDANRDRVSITERTAIFAGPHFSRDDRSIADVHLNSMSPDAEPHAEPKGIR